MLITIYAKTSSPARATSRRNFRKRRLNADANATIHKLCLGTFRVPVCALRCFYWAYIMSSTCLTFVHCARIKFDNSHKIFCYT